ncbi:hypothetical protein [Nostoc sp. ChiVER01]|nr:hypothetical protein [Nostoc sp. ChiVER01]MDZ8223596.1 hypothetical protein [Nostoc sp. ChiVER01]
MNRNQEKVTQLLCIDCFINFDKGDRFHFWVRCIPNTANFLSPPLPLSCI